LVILLPVLQYEQFKLILILELAEMMLKVLSSFEVVIEEVEEDYSFLEGSSSLEVAPLD